MAVVGIIRVKRFSALIILAKPVKVQELEVRSSQLMAVLSI
jgi:hypothetical protein